MLQNHLELMRDHYIETMRNAYTGFKSSGTVDVSGRVSRSAYWYFVAPVFAISFVVGLIGSFVPGGAFLMLLVGLAHLLPGIVMGVRRLHDTDRSGWFLLVGLIPFVGGLVVLYWAILPGTEGANRFGDVPADLSVRPLIA